MTNQLNIEPLHNDFGARVTGIVLSGDLSNADMSLIRDAIDSYSILCFPDQDMTDEKQLAVTRLIGEPSATFRTTAPSAATSTPTPITRLVTSCGIQTRPFARCRPSSQLSMLTRFRGKAARPSSPACARAILSYPATCEKLSSRFTWSMITSFPEARSRQSIRITRLHYRRSCTGWCRKTRPTATKTVTSVRTPARSLVGPVLTVAACSTTYSNARRNRKTYTLMTGGLVIR